MTTPPIGPVPFLVAGPDGTGTGLVGMPQPQALPVVWAGLVTAGEPAARWPWGGEAFTTAEVTGAVLAGVGIDLPAVRPLTAVVVFAEAV